MSYGIVSTLGRVINGEVKSTEKALSLNEVLGLMLFEGYKYFDKKDEKLMISKAELEHLKASAEYDNV